MRPIKFRAWLKADKKMFEVGGIKFYAKIPYVSLYTRGNDEDYNDFSLNDVELMQFTGLKDKNGKEIYEGDILEYDFLPEGKDQRDEVVFKNGRFCLRGGNNYMPEGEIIGNVYENPELLK